MLRGQGVHWGDEGVGSALGVLELLGHRCSAVGACNVYFLCKLASYSDLHMSWQCKIAVSMFFLF